MDYLSSTGPWGRYWHSRIYELKTNVIFQRLQFDGWNDTHGYAYVIVNQIGAWFPRPNEKTVILVAIIVHEMAHIRWHRSKGRYIQTAEECYLKEQEEEQQAANWLREAGQRYTTLEEVKRVWTNCEAFGS